MVISKAHAWLVQSICVGMKGIRNSSRLYVTRVFVTIVNYWQALHCVSSSWWRKNWAHMPMCARDKLMRSELLNLKLSRATMVARYFSPEQPWVLGIFHPSNHGCSVEIFNKTNNNEEQSSTPSATRKQRLVIQQHEPDHRWNGRPGARRIAIQEYQITSTKVFRSRPVLRRQGWQQKAQKLTSRDR